VTAVLVVVVVVVVVVAEVVGYGRVGFRLTPVHRLHHSLMTRSLSQTHSRLIRRQLPDNDNSRTHSQWKSQSSPRPASVSVSVSQRKWCGRCQVVGERGEAIYEESRRTV
jgi:hypothetical protein